MPSTIPLAPPLHEICPPQGGLAPPSEGWALAAHLGTFFKRCAAQRRSSPGDEYAGMDYSHMHVMDCDPSDFSFIHSWPGGPRPKKISTPCHVTRFMPVSHARAAPAIPGVDVGWRWAKPPRCGAEPVRRMTMGHWACLLGRIAWSRRDPATHWAARLRITGSSWSHGSRTPSPAMPRDQAVCTAPGITDSAVPISAWRRTDRRQSEKAEDQDMLCGALPPAMAVS